jgi:glycosyltransferase involved in cell wall biosynthesis
MENKIALLHPYILHYREEFFKTIQIENKIDIYCYESNDNIKKSNFAKSSIETTEIGSFKIGPFLFYSPFPFLRKEYSVVVLMLNFTHLTTWFLLLTKFIHKKKIITWGHGISVKRYVQETEHPSLLLKWLIKLSDGVWFYTEKEMLIWKEKYPDKLMISLNNTVSYTDKILHLPKIDKYFIKQKYNIKTERNIIFCARFNEPARRVDILEETILLMENSNVGFIIIGDGKLKPDFSKYRNVYDYGSVYDKSIKDDLFAIADIYYQPGWVGLSIVEAMAYGKPIFTFKRTKQHLQCVEYGYIEQNKNGIIFENIQELIYKIENISSCDIARMGKNAKSTVHTSLSMNNMTTRASFLLNKLRKKHE